MASTERRKPLLAVFLTVLIDLLGFGLILPLLPLYADRYHASNATIGLLFASFSGMQFLFAPLWGRLSDRVGRRPVIMVGLCGSVASYVLFALADVLPHPVAILFVSRILAGLFGGTITTAYAYIADVTPKEHRGHGMALVGAAFGIGFTLGPAIGGLGHHYLGSMAPGLIAAAFSTAALLFAIFRLPEPERHEEAPRGAWLKLGALPRALELRGVPVLLLVAFLTTVAFAEFESTLAQLANLRFEGWGPKTNGFLFSYIGFWLTLSQGWFVRRFMSKIGERRFVRAGTLCIAGGLLLVSIADTPWLLALLSPVAVIGFAMVTPSISSLLSQRAPATAQGEVLGVNQSMLGLARIIGPVLGYRLLAVELHVPYVVGACLMAAAFACSWFIGAAP
jgi:MFS family permease